MTTAVTTPDQQNVRAAASRAGISEQQLMQFVAGLLPGSAAAALGSEAEILSSIERLRHTGLTADGVTALSGRLRGLAAVDSRLQDNGAYASVLGQLSGPALTHGQTVSLARDLQAVLDELQQPASVPTVVDTTAIDVTPPAPPPTPVPWARPDSEPDGGGASQ